MKSSMSTPQQEQEIFGSATLHRLWSSLSNQAHRPSSSVSVLCAFCGSNGDQRKMIHHPEHGWFCNQQEWVTFIWNHN